MKLLYIFIAVCLSFCAMESQIPGLPAPPKSDRDSTIYFEPARPLIEYTDDNSLFPQHAGFFATYSGNGLGLGGFYDNALTDLLSITIRLSAGNATANEELEFYNPISGRQEVSNKINRIYFLPLDINLKYHFLGNDVESSLRPFFCAGFSPLTVFSNPYREGRNPNGQVVNFFSSFADPISYLRVGGNVSFGANWGTNPKRDNRVEIIYYYLPFGGDGIESVFGDPIKDFGGIYLSASFGWDI